MLANGVRCTLLAAPAASPLAFSPLRVVDCGDGHSYAVIPGECKLALRLHNTSGMPTSVYFYLEGALANAVVLLPGELMELSTWKGGAVPFTVGALLGSDSLAAALSPDLACASVRVHVSETCPPKPTTWQHYSSLPQDSKPRIVPEGKKALEFGYAPAIPVATTTVTQVSSYTNIGVPVMLSWRLRDEAGIDFVRERNGLPPFYGKGSASAAPSAAAAASAAPPASSSGGGGGRRGRGKPAAQQPSETGKRRAAAALERDEVVDLTADEGALRGPTEPVEIDLTHGGHPSVTRLARFKLCANDGTFTLRDALVPDPEDASDGVFDSRGYDAFVCSLLDVAAGVLWPSAGGGGGSSSDAQSLWDLRGKPLLTRAAAIAAGTVVVGRSATESFKSAAML